MRWKNQRKKNETSPKRGKISRNTKSRKSEGKLNVNIDHRESKIWEIQPKKKYLNGSVYIYI